MMRFLRYTFSYVFVPLFLMTVTPVLVVVFWLTCVRFDGSMAEAYASLSQDPWLLYRVWNPLKFGSSTARTYVAVFAVFQLLLMKLVPGKTRPGPVTPMGNVPVYKDNGFRCYVITMATLYLTGFHYKLWNPASVYDEFGAILFFLEVYALVFCLFLYLKGILAPSTTDSGSSGNPIFDYYWGTELYPRVLGWDIKVFTNCRMGMMGWPVAIVCFAAAQAEREGRVSEAMVVNVAIQLVYLTKFFLWEIGYMRSIDIMVDRAGYYICWGCLCWVPSLYYSTTFYLVNHPRSLGGVAVSFLWFAVGAACIITNYLADVQRQDVRETNGKCLVWGKKPVLVRAKYRTETGEEKSSLLLASGWWGIGRHSHYVFEVAGALSYSLVGGTEHVFPFCYVIFLTGLLLQRAYRDDLKCAKKYGKYWDIYKQAVPWVFIPGIW